MSEIISKGYLINRSDYGFFDEIITFINEYGNIFTCIALGVKKIKSKNARNLIFGKQIEFEFFLARNSDKVNKLKRAKLLENKFDIEFTNNVLLFLNSALFKSKINGENVYKFYESILVMIESKKYQDELIIIYILINLIRFSGIKMNLNECAICKNKKIANFSEKDFGFICVQCNNEHEIKIDIDVIKILFLINNKMFEKANQFTKNKYIYTIKLLIYFYTNNGGPNLFSICFY